MVLKNDAPLMGHLLEKYPGNTDIANLVAAFNNHAKIAYGLLEVDLWDIMEHIADKNYTTPLSLESPYRGGVFEVEPGASYACTPGVTQLSATTYRFRGSYRDVCKVLIDPWVKRFTEDM